MLYSGRYLGELYLIVVWKAVSGELGNLNEEVSKESVEGEVWFLLAAYSKTWEERDKVKKELLSKMEPTFDWEFLNLSRLHKILN